MSFAATTWAYGNTIGLPGPKAVLVALAYFADQGGCCFPSQTKLAAMTELCERSVRGHLQLLERRELISRTHRRLSSGEWAHTGYQLLMRDSQEGNADHPQEMPIATESPPATPPAKCSTLPTATVAADPSDSKVDLNYRSENKYTPPYPPQGGSVCEEKSDSTPERKPAVRANGGPLSKFSKNQCREFAEFKHRTRQGIDKPGGYAWAIYRDGRDDDQMEEFFSPLFQQAASRKPDLECLKCHGTGSEIVEGKGARVCDCSRAA